MTWWVRARTFVKEMMTPAKATPLGRWCHPSSDAYKTTCNQEVKAMLNIYDHGHVVDRPLTATAATRRSSSASSASSIVERDPLTVFLDGFGT